METSQRNSLITWEAVHMLCMHNEYFFKFSAWLRDTVTSNSLYCSEGSLCWNVSWSYHLKAKRNCPNIMHSNSSAPCSIALFSKNSCFKRKLLFGVSQRQLNCTLKVAIGFVETFRNIKYSYIWFSKIQDSKGIHQNNSNIIFLTFTTATWSMDIMTKQNATKEDKCLENSLFPPVVSSCLWIILQS